MGRKSSSTDVYRKLIDEHQDTCWSCSLGGTLLCCDTCTLSYHMRCAGLKNIPKGVWSCPVCVKDSALQKATHALYGRVENPIRYFCQSYLSRETILLDS